MSYNFTIFRSLAIGTCLLFLSLANSFAQGVTVGSNTPPHASATLDITSTTGGLLLPRLTTTQRNAIQNPAVGLQVYNTTTDCLEMYFFTGGWKKVQCGCNGFPNANFVVPNAYVNQPASFTTVPNMTYSWTFQSGSPATSASQSPQVTWSSGGNYTVTLTLTDSAGCSASQSATVTVSNCLAATGGTITTSGPYKIHTFTSSGTFNPGTCVAQVEYLVVAGGGGGGDGNAGGGGGGAGGFVEGVLSVTPGNIAVVVGAGGAGSATQDAVGQPGNNSSFGSIIAIGGGRGGGYAGANGGTGGSGGGGSGPTGSGQGGASNQTSPLGGTGYGFSGAAYAGGNGGGGGGAGGAATNHNGGPGRSSSISGSPVFYAGGGGGARYQGSQAGVGGTGGGGNGGYYPSPGNGQNGTPNTGGGGGGSGDGPIGGTGGSGIVIIRYQ